MKILYYAKLHLREFDGPSKHVLSVCQELSKLGHNILLITYPLTNNIHIHGIKTVQVPELSKLIPQSKKLNTRLWRAFCRLSASLFQPDVIYQRDRMDDSFPIELSQRAYIPLIIEVNGWLPNDAYRDGGEFSKHRAIERLAVRYQHASAIITPSPGLRNLIINTFSIPYQKVVYIANGVDMEHFKLHEPYQAPTGRFPTVGMMCGYYPLIDRENAIYAIALLRKRGVLARLQLVLYGPAQNVSLVKRAVIDLDLTSEVQILQNVPFTEIPNLIRQFDIALSLYKRERIMKEKTAEGLKLWEYWAMQRPVIITDIPGSYSYHHHLEKRYLAVEPENPQALADAIELLWRSPSLAEELARNGYEYVRNGHSWADTAREIEKVLLKVVRHP